MLPVGFNEFEVGYIFLLLFFFILSLSIGTRSILAKIWGGRGVGGAEASRPSPVSTGLLWMLNYLSSDVLGSYL